jgi:hypothetical protein
MFLYGSKLGSRDAEESAIMNTWSVVDAIYPAVLRILTAKMGVAREL